MSGYGETRYIVDPTTRGALSCPRSTPVEKLNPTCNLPTFETLISSSPLYRVLAEFLAGTAHCPSSSLGTKAGAAGLSCPKAGEATMAIRKRTNVTRNTKPLPLPEETYLFPGGSALYRLL